MNRPDLRASDADRERVVRCLERHTSAGRLSLDEHADRVERTVHARTHGELAAVLADLPAEPAGSEPAAVHQLLVAFLIAGVALVVLTALMLLR
ncbi:MULTISPECIES: DUF1707 SHOCT-like domain-containing protein [unclassified Solwaraspora]|uniref:DUF1707 SHOCT-like domain-containing protein n=1 Tax=unclassified Solwaraspora TaxID=2627926 RepID=UPI00259BB42B|nr:DUF1707 domain-containing protein [Solwaraspora sp. WMMA2056]WJK40394.1 DUF1707 domain-containing protein [Solwaraspora sp. WMMA2056]